MGPVLTPLALFYQKEKEENERKEAGTHVTPSEHEVASLGGSQGPKISHAAPASPNPGRPPTLPKPA